MTKLPLIVNTTEGKQAVRESRSISPRGGCQTGNLLHDGGRRGARPPAMRWITWATSKSIDCKICTRNWRETNSDEPCTESCQREAHSHDSSRRRAAAAGTETTEERGAAQRHQGHRRSAAPQRRFVGRMPNTMRRANNRASSRGASTTSRNRLSNSEVIDVTKLTATGRVVLRRHGPAGGPGRQRQSELPAGRRRRGQHQGRAAVGLLPDRAARAHRQIRGGCGRCDDAGRYAPPTKSCPCATCRRRPVAAQVRSLLRSLTVIRRPFRVLSVLWAGKPVVGGLVGDSDPVRRGERSSSGRG